MTISNAPTLETIQPNPAREKDMPYAPAVRIVGACDLMFISGVTPSPLYHFHPHIDEEHRHPNGIGEQVDLAMAGAKQVMDNVGASWGDVVKITKYLTDMRDMEGMSKALSAYFGDWKPASTTICINQLSSPGARVELDMIVALPRKA